MKIAGSIVVCVAATTFLAAEDRPPTRVYTNEDLVRVRDRRGETGVTSEAAPAAGTPAVTRRGDRSPVQAERYWRQAAERERRRLAVLQDRLLVLEQRLAERRSAPTPRSGVRPPTDGLEAQIGAQRRRIREQQALFEDRARREGALPGWLR